MYIHRRPTPSALHLQTDDNYYTDDSKCWVPYWFDGNAWDDDICGYESTPANLGNLRVDTALGGYAYTVGNLFAFMEVGGWMGQEPCMPYGHAPCHPWLRHAPMRPCPFVVAACCRWWCCMPAVLHGAAGVGASWQ